MFESVTQAGSALAQTAGIDGSEANANIIELLTRMIAGGFAMSDAGAITLTVAPTFPGSSLTALNADNITTGTLAVARGGTGLASYAVGDLLYASAAAALSKLAAVAAGQVLVSAGVTTAPAWSATPTATSWGIADSDASHYLRLKTSSDLTVDRDFTLVPGDAARTVTLSGNPTLDDWFDQSVKQAASPSFAGLTLSGGFTNTGLKVLDTGGDHALTIAPGTDLAAARTLTLTTGDADRTITLSGNPTLSDWFDQSVKAAASPTFVGLTLSGAIATPTNITASGNITTSGSQAIYSQRAGSVTKVQSVGTEIGFAVGVSKTFTFSVADANGYVFIITDHGTGFCALCVGGYASATIVISGDARVVNSATPGATEIGVSKGASGSTITVKTGSGVSGQISICLLGSYATATTDPA